MRKQALFVGDLGALKDLGDPERGREMLRLGIIAELDAVNLYTQMSELAEDTSIKKIMIDIAKEEKTHAGEFQALLERIDKEYAAELDAGKKEVEEKTAGYNKSNLIEKMAAIANGLDDFGFVKDASVIDGMMRKVAFLNYDTVAQKIAMLMGSGGKASMDFLKNVIKELWETKTLVGDKLKYFEDSIYPVLKRGGIWGESVLMYIRKYMPDVLKNMEKVEDVVDIVEKL